MAVNIGIQPPTPNMQDRELLQWQQRVYEALKEVIVEVGGSVVVTDHNDLENNGGENSHISITNHINNSRAHGISGNVVGTSDSQTLTNKTMNGDNNVFSNLKHGEEVDNPSSNVHGISGKVVGTSDSQTLTNKTINGNNNNLSNLKHGEEVDNSTNNVHGAQGDVVGVNNTQILVNKVIIEKQLNVEFDYTPSEYDCILRILGAHTITLPAAFSYQNGFYLRIDNLHTASITVNTEGSETIQGESSQEVPANCCMVVQADRGNWRII